jgi:NADH-quinone oxidoreductase subunit E
MEVAKLERLGKVDEIVRKHGGDKEAIIQILLDVQKEFRWLPKDILKYLGHKLDIPLNHIYNLASFYAHFSLVPKGRHSVSVCVGTACHVRGAERLLDRVGKQMGLKPGETSRDEKFSLDTVSCLGCCALGPVMVSDGEYKSDPSVEDVKAFIDECD